MECDRLGRVNWLSAEARLALGDADHLVKCHSNGVGIGPGSEVGCPWSSKPATRVWISARLPNPRKSDLREETIGLRNLQDNLARQCFRLQNAERSLSTRTLQMRAGGGRRAVLLVERERERLGRELHTGVGQMLVAIRTQLEIIVAQLPAAPDMVQEAIDRISTLLGETLEQVRSVSRKLHPPEWLRLTLETALRQLWEISGIPERYQASLQLTVLPEEPDLEVKILMYRAAQEALSNLTQHSKATRIDMSLVVGGGQPLNPNNRKFQALIATTARRLIAYSGGSSAPPAP